MTENNLASSSSSGTRWGKCRPTFPILLNLDLVRFSAAKESKILNLAANPYSNAKCFLICMNRATKELEDSVVNIISSNSSAGVCKNNRSTKCKSFTCLNNRLLFIHVTSAVGYAQLHGWPYWTVSNLQHLIMILIRVWGCETDWRCFVSPL